MAAFTGSNEAASAYVCDPASRYVCDPAGHERSTVLSKTSRAPASALWQQNERRSCNPEAVSYFFRKYIRAGSIGNHSRME